MLNLPVDEAYAFDYLAILLVKGAHGLDTQHEHEGCRRQLAHQMEWRQFAGVCASEEFHALVRVNEALYQACERLRSGHPVTTAEMDRLNLQRWEAKQLLQRLWFASPLQELKTAVAGYGAAWAAVADQPRTLNPEP
jgi:hypothetical protein